LQLSILIDTEHIRNAGAIYAEGMRRLVIANLSSLFGRCAGGLAAGRRCDGTGQANATRKRQSNAVDVPP
jgi:hypothetical protein